MEEEKQGMPDGSVEGEGMLGSPIGGGDGEEPDVLEESPAPEMEDPAGGVFSQIEQLQAAQAVLFDTVTALCRQMNVAQPKRP